MRSCFFPKKTRKGLEIAKKFQPDIVILDLEDSVQLHEKPSIRKLYLDALRDKIFPDNIKVFIRSSPLDNYEDIKEDISTFTGSGITGFMLPKVESPESVIAFENILAKKERERGLKEKSHTFIPILETPGAYFQAHDILSSTQRMIAVLAGSGDFTAHAVCDDHSLAYDTFFAQMVLAAKTTGCIALWGVHDKIDDHIGFEKIAMKMKQAGYQGVVSLTPKQITLANQIYSFLHAEKNWTDSVLKKSGNVVNVIQRSVQESRQMIGPPHKLKAQNIINSRIETCPSVSQESIRGMATSLKGICPGIQIGQVVSASHEAHVTESWKTAWDSSFINSNAYENNYSKVYKTSATPLPFSLATTMAVAFSVANLSYYARVHLGFKNIFQHRPLLTGDRVRAMFRIDSVNSKKGGDGRQYSVLHSTHWLINQCNQITTQLQKLTMFQPEDCQIKLTTDENAKTKTFQPYNSIIRKSILETSPDEFLPSTSQQPLVPGTLLVHDLVKVMGHSETRMLCNLLHIVNPHHHNKIRYQPTDLLVPGPFVMSAGMSAANLDIGEIIYEEIPVCINPNKVNFGDQLGTVTFIVNSRPLSDNLPEFEEVTLKHFVVKNTDMSILTKVDFPLKLFDNGHMKPSEYEALCGAECPVLLHKIACVVTRKIIRARPGYFKSHDVPQELITVEDI